MMSCSWPTLTSAGTTSHSQIWSLNSKLTWTYLDNRNRRNNLSSRGDVESVTDLLPAVQRLFQSLLPKSLAASFACNRIHRALRPKPPDDKPPRDIVLCFKECLVKEEILRASRNTPNILLDGAKIQIYPDLSLTRLDKHCKMKEIATDTPNRKDSIQLSLQTTGPP